MAIDVAVIVLILAIAFYQAVQGMFSAIVMAILSVVCAMAALNFYEPLALMLSGRLGACAHSVALLAVFAIPLLLVRMLFDRVIRGNVVMGMWTDRIGGGAFGLITGAVLMGMLTLIVMQLPLPGSFLAYRPYDAGLEPEHKLGARKAANFTLALARHCSKGSLSPLNRPADGQTFADAHPDLFLEGFCFRNRPGPGGGRASTPVDALEVQRVYRLPAPDASDERYKAYVENLRARGYTQDQIDRSKVQLERLHEQTPKYPLTPLLADTQVYVVRVTVDELARNEEDHWYRLSGTHFRLTTDKHASYYPVGYLTFAGRWRVESADADAEKARPADLLVARQWDREAGPKKLLVDWVYRIPVGENPREVIFRRVARVTVLPLVDGVPSPKDGQGRLVGLTVKPGSGVADFEILSGRRLIRPVEMAFRSGMHPAFYMRIRRDGTKPPGIYDNAELQGASFFRGVVSTTRPEIDKLSGRESRPIYDFHAPAGLGVIRLDCQVDRTFPAHTASDMLARVNPQLVLADGRKLSHRGGYVAWGPADNQRIFVYYEPRPPQPMTGLHPEFRQALGANLSTVLNEKGFGFVFLTPIRRDVSVVGVTFGEDLGPDYEFYSRLPMTLDRRRR